MVPRVTSSSAGPGAGMPRMLPGCRARPHPAGLQEMAAPGSSRAQTRRLGARCQELLPEPRGQSWDPQGSSLGLALVLKKRPGRHGQLQTLGQHSTPAMSYIDFIVKAIFSGVRQGCKTRACSLMQELSAF